MSDLTVSYDELSHTRKDLRTLHREFEHCTKNQRDMRDEYGHPPVAAAMERFTTGWDKHRGELVEQLKSVEKLVSSAIKNFQDTDTKVAESSDRKKK